MNNLAQFYTQDCISSLLISKILVKNPKTILELGTGDGALFRVARKKWKKSEMIGGDIDQENISTLKKEFPKTKLYVLNGLSSKLPSDLKIEFGTVDVAICNPPYIPINKTEEFGTIIALSKLGALENYKNLTSDLIFLAQNLLMLKDGGELGIILPDGLLTCHNFEEFRKNLIKNYKVKGIIELSGKSFLKTEAKTHILIIKKCSLNYKTVPLFLADINGKITDKIRVSKKLLNFRMDFKFQSWNSKKELGGQTLNDIGTEIYRGSLSKKMLVDSREEFIHTSNFKKQYDVASFKENLVLPNYRYAEKGDILMSRVGKRCLGKILFVQEGRILISDCVYRIRIKDILQRKKVLDSLNNKRGLDWIKAHSHGVCAKVISKRDLLNFQFWEI